MCVEIEIDRECVCVEREREIESVCVCVERESVCVCREKERDGTEPRTFRVWFMMRVRVWVIWHFVRFFILWYFVRIPISRAIFYYKVLKNIVFLINLKAKKVLPQGFEWI